jgi:Cytidylate kinase-like family
MTVIAITHEIGTIGDELAAMLAEHFRLAYADRQYLEHRIADRWAERERGYNQLRSGVGRFKHFTNVSTSRLAKYAADEIVELAAYGDVVLRGWGATAVLRDSPHVLCVRICASMNFRERILAASKPNLTGSEICRTIHESDAMLSSNQEPVFGPGWRRDESYDVVLRSDLLSLRQVVEAVEHALQRMHEDKRQPHTESRRAKVTMRPKIGEGAQITRTNRPPPPLKDAPTR